VSKYHLRGDDENPFYLMLSIGLLFSRKEFLVFTVPANPEPRYGIIVEDTDSSIPKGYLGARVCAGAM
jgi:hypothetical protein